MNIVSNQFQNSIDPDLGKISQERVSQSNGLQAEKTGSSTGFLEAFQKSLEDVNQTQASADVAIKDLVAGRNKNIHETMLAVQKADLSLKTMMQVRNKVLEAYKEVMRMQV